MSSTPTPIRLRKLPERALVKMTIMLSPDLHSRLGEYAMLYHDTYGTEERVTELIPYMLESFLDGDRSFTRRRSKRR